MTGRKKDKNIEKNNKFYITHAAKTKSIQKPDAASNVRKTKLRLPLSSADCNIHAVTHERGKLFSGFLSLTVRIIQRITGDRKQVQSVAVRTERGAPTVSRPQTQKVRSASPKRVESVGVMEIIEVFWPPRRMRREIKKESTICNSLFL